MPSLERVPQRLNSDAVSSARRHRPDYWLLILCVALLVVGLIVIYAISPALSMANNVSNNFFIVRQSIAIALSLIVFFVTARIPMSSWHKWCKPLIIVAVLATLVALVMPANPQYPAHRWIRLGSLSFQSVELVKFALLIWLSAFLNDRIKDNKINSLKDTFKPVAILVLVIGFVVAWRQSDFGSTMVMMAMTGIMVFVAGMPMKRIMIIVGILAVLGTLAISAIPYRRARITAFLHQDTSNCASLTTGYQACQAIVSVGSGGLIGLGLGRSVQAYGYLPEAANDSIFAIYAEKFGFIGVAVLLALFMAFFNRLKSLAERAPDNFSRLIIIGVLTWLGVQTVINVGAMVGILPLKGITLPFISYGGTSVVFVMAAMGIVFQISRYTTYASIDTTDNGRGARRENRFDGRRIRGAYHPDPSGRI